MRFKIFKDKNNVYLLKLEKMEDYYKLIKQNKDKIQVIMTTEIMKEVLLHLYYYYGVVPQIKDFEKNKSVDTLNILFRIEDCYKSKRLLEHQFDVLDNQTNMLEKISFYKRTSGKLEFEIYVNGIVYFYNEDRLETIKDVIANIVLEYFRTEVE